MGTIDSKAMLRTLQLGERRYRYYSLDAAAQAGLGEFTRLPFTLRVVLENVLRQHAAGQATDDDVHALAGWLAERRSDREIGLRPARVMMVDSSGIPLLGDMAAMREASVALGGDPRRINPVAHVDFIIDHGVVADEAGTAGALARNLAIEFERNRERYAFLNWGQRAFDKLRIVPPGNGICHQINLEYLARVVWTDGDLAFPDSVLGMDSHTPMINSLGVIGWGVGGLEGGAAALGEAVSMLIPEVVGCRMTGRLRAGVTATDLVLTVTQRMRNQNVLGKFVEFFGPGVDTLALQDRSTISNMTPEFGATMGYFPIDAETLRYLRLTGRDEPHVALVEAYARAQGLWRDTAAPAADYSEVVELDLASVEPCMAGPRRPHERVALAGVPAAFEAAFPPGGPVSANAGVTDGSVVIAAITSCTNTSNPSVMIAAGLLARNAVKRGMRTKPWVKTSLSPGSRVVADYLARAGLQEPLDVLGFRIAGFGCMTCMGNSGPLAAPVANAIDERKLCAVAVISANRNFEGRVHPQVRANFLASPPLVVAHALTGTVRSNLDSEPLGLDRDGQPVFLHELWPDADEVRDTLNKVLDPEMFRARYATVYEGGAEWQALAGPDGDVWRWDADSAYLKRPPFFEDMGRVPTPLQDIRGARMLAMFGDMLTTDHISPIGAISPQTPAGEYLTALGIARNDYSNYASRRLNHEVMIRGTFANIRIRNELTPEREGGYTRLQPAGEVMTIFDAAQRYRATGTPLVIVAGSEYGAGSSRDWAAKGARMLGVQAIIAESFERIHRSNLVGMGVLPLQFAPGVTRKTLALAGDETFDLAGLADLAPRKSVSCRVTRADGRSETIALTARLDTQPELDYYRHGGILHFLVRSRL